MSRPELIKEIFKKYLLNSIEFLETRGLSHEKDLEYCHDQMEEINALLKDSDALPKEKQELQVAPSCQMAQEIQDLSQNKIKNEDKKKEIESFNSNKVFVKLKPGTESNKNLKEKGLKKAPTTNTNPNKQASNKNKILTQINKNEEDPVINNKPSKHNHKVNLSLNLTYTKLDFNKKLDKNHIFRNENKKDSFKVLKQTDTDRSNDKTKEINKYSSKDKINNKVKNENKKEKIEAKYNTNRTIRISHLKNNSTSFAGISDYVTESNTLTNRFIGNILNNSLLLNTTLSPPSHRRHMEHSNSEKRRKYKLLINKEINDDSKVNEIDAENNHNDVDGYENNPTISIPGSKYNNDRSYNSASHIISLATVQDNNLLNHSSTNVNNKILDLNIHNETFNNDVNKKEKTKNNSGKILGKKEYDNYNFTRVMEEKWDYIVMFLSKNDYYKMRICNRKFCTLSNESLLNYLQEELKVYTEKINVLREKNSEEIKKLIPAFSLGRSSSKAIELLDQDKYKNLFRNKVFPSEDILLPYRIYFTIIRRIDIANIHEDQTFWEECCKFFNVDQIGNMLFSSTKLFDFSLDSIYSIFKLSYNKDKKLASSYFTKICPTTGIIIFLIREILEYSGIFINQKFPPTPNKMLKLYQAIVEGNTRRIEKIKQFKKL